MRSSMFGDNGQYSIGAAHASFLLDDAIVDKDVVSEVTVAEKAYSGFTVAFPGTDFKLSVIIPLDVGENQVALQKDELCFCPVAETLLVTHLNRPVYDAELGYSHPRKFRVPFKSVVQEYVRVRALLMQ